MPDEFKDRVIIRKNDENNPFWQAAKRAAERVATWPLWKLGVMPMRERRLGDYGPSSRDVEAHGHPTPLPLPPAGEYDDGPLTERCPSNQGFQETEINISDLASDEPHFHDKHSVSLFMGVLIGGGIYLVRRPHQVSRVPEPMYLRTYQDDIAEFQDMVGERLTMGTNLARESVVQRYTTKDILEALARTV
jgi:hypothetical protein